MDIERYNDRIKELFIKIDECRSESFEQSIEYCNELESRGRDLQDDALIGYACYTKGELFYLNNDMPDFYREMLTCMPPLEREHEWSYVVMANNMLGIMSLNRGNAPFAMDYYIKALEICRRYRLLDLEWIVHMNMGTLYLSVDDEQNALQHLREGYGYLKDHSSDDSTVINIAAACVNMGKAHLSMGDMESAEHYWNKLREGCIPRLEDKDKIAIYCFGARFYNEMGETDLRDDCIATLGNIITKNQITVMDTFDDIYEYLNMLLEIRKKKDFAQMWIQAYEMTKKTTVLDMERRLLELQLKFYTAFKEEEAYSSAVMEYARVSMDESRERKLMVANMIALRTSLQDLTNINHKVERENEMLQKKSETDPLTGLSNRFGFNEYWERAFEKAYQSRESIAIEILDIDYFKEYNDNYGHQAGDKCLTTVADCMKAIERRGGIFCARYGGDEFVIIYEGYNEKEVMEISSEFTGRIQAARIEHKFSKAADMVTVSQGICCGIPVGTVKAFDYMHTADVMLYQVKEHGKNGTRISKCMEWGK